LENSFTKNADVIEGRRRNKMKKIGLLILVLFSSNSAFADVILEGVIEQGMCIHCAHTYRLDCEIDDQGNVALEKMNDGVTSNKNKNLSAHKTRLIKSLLQEVKNHPNQLSGSMCDAGGAYVQAIRGNEAQLISGHQDCGDQVKRSSLAAKRLGHIVRRACEM
jgi:hypothetical protein